VVSKNGPTTTKVDPATVTASKMPTASQLQPSPKQEANKPQKPPKPETNPADSKTVSSTAVAAKTKEEIVPTRATKPNMPAFSSLSVEPETNIPYKPILHVENSNVPAPAVKQAKKADPVVQQQK